jgi:outer membrane biosynthesis protein TonB
MGAMVVVLVLAVALIRWWPVNMGEDPASLFRDRPSSRIHVREIQPTNQAQEKNPPPPAPLPPVVVPNDVLVKEELTFGEGELQIDTPGEDEKLQDGTAQATAARQPDTEARLLKNVQPNYPQAARRDRVRARIKVEVHVSETGNVRRASITERWRLYEDGSARPVPQLGYGLEEAALAAAQRSLFRPAQARGQNVETRTILTFTFGPR